MVALDFMSGVVTLLTALMIGRSNNLTTICAALIILSVLGAFEGPTVQACIPQMQTGGNIIRANAVVNQISAVSALAAPFIGSMLYTAFGLKPVMYVGVFCFFCNIHIRMFHPAGLHTAADGRTRFYRL